DDMAECRNRSWRHSARSFGAAFRLLPLHPLFLLRSRVGLECRHRRNGSTRNSATLFEQLLASFSLRVGGVLHFDPVRWGFSVARYATSVRLATIPQGPVRTPSRIMINAPDLPLLSAARFAECQDNAVDIPLKHDDVGGTAHGLWRGGRNAVVF